MFPTLQLVEIFDSGLFLIFLNVFSKPQAKPPARYPVAPHSHLHAPGIVMLPTLLYSNIKQALDFVNIVLKFCHFYYCQVARTSTLYGVLSIRGSGAAVGGCRRQTSLTQSSVSAR